MNKSELIDSVARRQTHLGTSDVELAVKSLIDQLAQALEQGERIEIRGFGSFSVSNRLARVGRNPKTGAAVSLPPKRVSHFKPGKELRDSVNAGLLAGVPIAVAVPELKS